MKTLLSLDEFRKVFSIHPWHFWGLAPESAPIDSKCNGLVPQYGWQAANAAGRTEIENAISQAENQLRSYLGYDVAPRYSSEPIDWPLYHDVGMWRHGYGSPDGWPLTVRYPRGHIIELGTERLTLLGTVAIAYSGQDGDGLNETFTATLATTETDATKIVAYFQTSDCLDGESIEIRPIKASISSGLLTITGRAWLMTKPVLYESISIGVGLNPATAGVLATQIHVYKRDTDTDQQATLAWDNLDYPCWAVPCGPVSSSDPAATATASARAGIRNARLGLVAPAESVYNAETATWGATDWNCYPPSRVTINALAGHELDDWRVVVARLAAAELSTAICACDKAPANRELSRWQADVSVVGEDALSFNVSPADLDNPLGTRFGHIYAWRAIRNKRLLQGVIS